MKILRNILYILILSSSLYSCDEEFLEKNPHDALSGETFWNTEEDILSGLAACYGRFHSTWLSSGTVDSGAGRIIYDGVADNIWFGNQGVQDINQSIQSPQTGGPISGLYGACFRAISTINLFIGNATDTEIDENIKTRYIAEARFLRAYLYHQLVQNYGGVPLFNDAPTIEDAKTGRSSEAEIMSFIHEDLNFAIENLPEQDFTSHAVKSSAQALRARVYLYEGKWSEAASLADDVISSGLFQLYPDYRNLFLQKAADGGESEFLFSIQFSAPSKWHTYEMAVGNWGVAVLDDLVMDYWTINGLPIDQDPDYNPDQFWLNRDPRLKASVFCEPGEPWALDPSGYILYRDGAIPTKCSIKKGLEGGFIADRSYLSDTDIPLLRYAEVLLTYAEAKNELGQFNEADWDKSIKMIRERAGFTAPVALDYPGGNQGSLREDIRHERRVELTFEGLRWYDLKRWKIAKQELENLQGENPLQRTFNESRDYLWPIPLSQIDYYESNEIDFPQNPGY